jgi:hypothetical protein
LPKPTVLLAVAAIVVAGCVPSTIDEPVPFQRSNGMREYQMFGEVHYTGSVETARTVVQTKLDQACGGKAHFLRFDATPDLSGPIDVVNFDAEATCE